MLYKQSTPSVPGAGAHPAASRHVLVAASMSPLCKMSAPAACSALKPMLHSFLNLRHASTAQRQQRSRHGTRCSAARAAAAGSSAGNYTSLARCAAQPHPAHLFCLHPRCCLGPRWSAPWPPRPARTPCPCTARAEHRTGPHGAAPEQNGDDEKRNLPRRLAALRAHARGIQLRSRTPARCCRCCWTPGCRCCGWRR